MSQFWQPQTLWNQMMAEIQDLKRRVNAITTADGSPNAPGTPGGATGVPVHDHHDIATGGLTEYAPAVPANWDGGTDPGNTNAALDQLAADDHYEIFIPFYGGG